MDLGGDEELNSDLVIIHCIDHRGGAGRVFHAGTIAAVATYFVGSKVLDCV